MCELCETTKEIVGARDSRKPWAEDPINNALPSWETARSKFEEYMDGIGLWDYKIDEVAVLFASRAYMGEFMSDALCGEGVVLFNHAYDHVTTYPFRTQYDVEYLFACMTASSMRVEGMAITGGFSPLHTAVATHMSEQHPLSIVHMSFKCDTEHQYDRAMETLDSSDDALLVQSCVSTYGKFSYWLTLDEEGVGSPIYLKPRVNLRDDRGEFGMPGVGNAGTLFEEDEWHDPMNGENS